VNNKKNNDEVLPVWDVDIGAWRSFRLDTITNVAKLEVV
jgi:predicted DNA-binding transcriptional regulator YafY